MLNSLSILAAGPGHWGHAGRKGQVGGSLPGKGGGGISKKAIRSKSKFKLKKKFRIKISAKASGKKQEKRLLVIEIEKGYFTLRGGDLDLYRDN